MFGWANEVVSVCDWLEEWGGECLYLVGRVKW